MVGGRSSQPWAEMHEWVSRHIALAPLSGHDFVHFESPYIRPDPIFCRAGYEFTEQRDRLKGAYAYCRRFAGFRVVNA